MAQAVNWIFIVLGFALGAPSGYAACHSHIWYKRTRSHIRIAAPLFRMAAYGLGGFLLLGLAGLAYLGVLR